MTNTSRTPMTVSKNKKPEKIEDVVEFSEEECVFLISLLDNTSLGGLKQMGMAIGLAKKFNHIREHKNAGK